MSKIYADMQRSAMMLSPTDLRDLGKDEVGYVRKYVLKGETAFVLHGADGTAIAVQKDLTAAQLSARHQELEVVAVH